MTLRRAFQVLAVLAAVGLAGCESSPTDSDEALRLRIVNDLDTPIQVRMVTSDDDAAQSRGDVDYGVIQPGETTSYRAASPTFFVFVNDTQFPEDGTEWAFGISNPPSPRWTLRIQPNGSWSQNAEFD